MQNHSFIDTLQSVDDFLNQNKISRSQLFKMATKGEIDLFLHLETMDGFIPGESSKIVVTGICKLLPHQCEKMLLNNELKTILLKTSLVLIEGIYQKYIIEQNNNPKILRSKSIKIKSTDKGLLFLPMIYEENEKHTALNPRYSLEPCAKDTEGKAPKNIYCYAIEAKKILVLSDHEQKN